MTGNRDDAHVIYRFDDVTVEPTTFSLLKAGVPAHIEPKALELLIYLIEQRERVVTKQELLDEVWKGTSVTENALTRAIAQIRKVLGDDLQTPRYIQTIPTRGYRFIAELGEKLPSPSPSPRPGRMGRVISTTIIAAFIILIVSLLKTRATRPSKEPIATRAPSIAARPLAPSQRLQAFPAFSPDGTAIVFSADDGGTSHIYRVSVDGGTESQLTHGEDGQTQPSWSPDGKSIAFVSARRGGIWIVPAAGGEPQQLTTSGSRPTWSPDGTEIAYQSGEQTDYGWTSFEALPPSTIWIVNVGTGHAARLTRSGEPAGGHGAPTWRADGKRLAFSSCDLERCGIFTIARDASALQTLVTDSRRLASPVFARDGRQIYYVLGRYNNSLLLSVPVDSDAARTGNPNRIRDSGPGMIEHLTVSRDGFRFAWTLVEESSDLFAMPIDQGAAVQLTRNPTLRTSFPAFSPDGTKIAYCAIAGGDDSGVWIADAADGRNAKGLAVGPGLKQHTQWSRSEWEVFYAAWHQRAAAVFKASLITGRADVLATLTRDASAPAVSPDGTRVAFNRTIEGKLSLWVEEVGGGAMRRLTPDGQLARNPIWSPSGKLLALQIRSPQGSGVGIMSAAGGPIRVLTSDRGESWPYSWSPDESAIAFAGRRDSVWNVWTVSINGGEPRRLTENESTNTWLRSPAWSPAGDRIIYESGAPRGNIWISEPRVTQ